MLILIFGPLAFFVLRLATRWRWRTVAWVALAIGLAADALGGLLARPF